LTVTLADVLGVIEKSSPVPVSATVCVPPVPLSVIVRVPDLVPPAVGSKKTPMVQLDPGETAAVQLLRTPKSAGDAVVLLIVRLRVPLFVTVTVCGSPVVPTYWLANVIAVGETVATADGPARPLPVKLTVCGLSEFRFGCL
jgi:hypothetical protein